MPHHHHPIVSPSLHDYFQPFDSGIFTCQEVSTRQRASISNIFQANIHDSLFLSCHVLFFGCVTSWRRFVFCYRFGLEMFLDCILNTPIGDTNSAVVMTSMGTIAGHSLGTCRSEKEASTTRTKAICFFDFHETKRAYRQSRQSPAPCFLDKSKTQHIIDGLP